MPSKPASNNLRAADQKLLLSLGETFSRPLDHPVADLLQELRELEATVKKFGTQLHQGTLLDKKTSGSLGARREMLEAAEADWSKHRFSLASKEQKAMRQEGETLKHDFVAALRYFAASDAEVQRRVDAVQIGTGLADLLDDLQKLAALVDEQASVLKKAQLPKKASDRARAIVESLGGAEAMKSTDLDGEAVMQLRNRAYWYARHAMDQVRAAGRYLFRTDPKALTLFRASSTHARHKSAPAPAEAPSATPS